MSNKIKVEVLKRSFEAAKFPIGSPERKKLNENSLTSEYMTSKKILALVHIPETEKYNPITLSNTFIKSDDAFDWVEKMIDKHNLENK